MMLTRIAGFADSKFLLKLVAQFNRRLNGQPTRPGSVKCWQTFISQSSATIISTDAARMIFWLDTKLLLESCFLKISYYSIFYLFTKFLNSSFDLVSIAAYDYSWNFVNINKHPNVCSQRKNFQCSEFDL